MQLLSLCSATPWRLAKLISSAVKAIMRNKLIIEGLLEPSLYSKGAADLCTAILKVQYSSCKGQMNVQECAYDHQSSS